MQTFALEHSQLKNNVHISHCVLLCLCCSEGFRLRSLVSGLGQKTTCELISSLFRWGQESWGDPDGLLCFWKPFFYWVCVCVCRTLSIPAPAPTWSTLTCWGRSQLCLRLIITSWFIGWKSQCGHICDRNSSSFWVHSHIGVCVCLCLQAVSQAIQAGGGTSPAVHLLSSVSCWSRRTSSSLQMLMVDSFCNQSPQPVQWVSHVNGSFLGS